VRRWPTRDVHSACSRPVTHRRVRAARRRAQRLLADSGAQPTRCEFKGAARYLDAIVDGRRVHAVAWTYRDPTPAYEALHDHVAFHPGRVDVAWMGNERVQAQASDFYGGWVTADLVGPFKGPPETLGS
jgi:hypothetical protein